MGERREGARKRQGLAVGALLALIRTYQLTLSSLLGRRCRFLPTCSDYAAQALRKYGLRRGGLLAARRILRCHPWGGSGFDPVPERLDET